MAESALGADCLLPALPSWARAFPGTAEQAAAARRFIAGLLDGSPFCDDAVLILCELFTNAVLHTASGKPGGLVIVQVSRWRAGVRIAVTDQGSHSQPTISYPGSHSGAGESGNGLFIADALATHLGWHDDVSGRTVCAILGEPPPRALSPSWPPAPGQAPSFGPPAATRTTCSAQPIWPWPLADGPGQHPQGDRFLPASQPGEPFHRYRYRDEPDGAAPQLDLAAGREQHPHAGAVDERDPGQVEQQARRPAEQAQQALLQPRPGVEVDFPGDADDRVAITMPDPQRQIHGAPRLMVPEDHARGLG